MPPVPARSSGLTWPCMCRWEEMFTIRPSPAMHGSSRLVRVNGPDVDLEPVGGPAFRHEHDPGVVDQDAQVPVPAVGEGAY
jgi:hypothetical protein